MVGIANQRAGGGGLGDPAFRGIRFVTLRLVLCTYTTTERQPYPQ